jgi:hypothetical protein
VSVYRAAADVYLESFPYGSQTALLEAALSGLAVVPAYEPLAPMLVASDEALRDILVNPQTEQEYLERVDLFIRERGLRAELGETLRNRVLSDHVGEGWLRRLASVYSKTDGLAHRPSPIPAAPCSTTDADTGLSLWCAGGHSKTSAEMISSDPVAALLRYAAYVAKHVGDYGTARRFAWQACQHDRSQIASWRVLAVAVLGRLGRTIRRVLLHS